MESTTTKVSRGKKFASFVIERVKKDAGFGAALRRADNPATEYQSWEHLAKWCDLEKSRERHAFATIAASIARGKPKQDGSLGIGRAIAMCYKEDNQSDPAKAKLRRLLACDSTEEACSTLRSVLSLVLSRGQKVDHGSLLDDLLLLNEKVKVRWANDFYKRKEPEQ
jgi:CRISPR system Cascade subunit CasB